MVLGTNQQVRLGLIRSIPHSLNSPQFHKRALHVRNNEQAEPHATAAWWTTPHIQLTGAADIPNPSPTIGVG